MKTTSSRWLGCAAAFVLIGLSVQLNAEPNVADSSLKLHLSFDQDFSGGQVVDLSGHGNHGWQFIPTNRVTPTNGVFGSVAAQCTANFVMPDTSGQLSISQ
jgi:hypothetical protein